jgi:multicomponent K+:H+ antiporter subunit A
MVLGALIALFKDDLKALLAFSTVSHLGLLTMLLGFGTQAAAVAAVFHIINHLTFKAALFMTAGIVDHEAHTRDIKRLGGLRHLMPITFVIGTVAALSMAGIPLFNGFLSKEMMLEEASHTDWAAAPGRAGAGHARRAAVGGLFLPLHRPRLPRAGARRLPAQAARPALRHVGRAGAAGRAGGGHRRGALPRRGHRDRRRQCRDRRRPAPASEDLARRHAGALDVGHRGAGRRGPACAAPPARPRSGSPRRAPRPRRSSTRLVAALVGADRADHRDAHNGAISRYLAIFTVASVALGWIAYSGSGLSAPTREMLPVPPVIAVGWLMLIVATGLGRGDAPPPVPRAGADRDHRAVDLGGVRLPLGAGPRADADLGRDGDDHAAAAGAALPAEDDAAESPAGLRLRDGAIALAAGGGVGALAYAFLMRDIETISDYHLANSYEGGGGTNVVNVILVDFRGYDTYRRDHRAGDRGL